ncbi:MAG: tetratricopeptide repeat protein [Planctomycetota bacterium]|nr:tetratricopeptide repeat protein [Planctomycetota bacterium]
MSTELKLRAREVRELIRSGQLDRARSLATRLARKHPQEAPANEAMCLVEFFAQNFDRAVYYGQRAADLEPGAPEPLANLGNCLVFAGKPAQAITSFERALALDPSHVAARRGLAQVLIDQGRLSDAADQFDVLLRDHPEDPRGLPPHAALLLEMGDAPRAAELLRRAVRAMPDDPRTASNLCSTLNYVDDVPSSEVFAAHRAYGDLIARRVRRLTPFVHPATDDPERPLRVGLLSGDLRNHSVAFFARSVIEGLRSIEPRSFGVAAYYTHPEEDETSRHLKSIVDAWRPAANLTPPQLGDLILHDRIDILIDLSGHTGGERHEVFPLRCAPVAATFIGYPNTTGVPGVDYRIADSFTDPPGPSDALCTERLVRLDPCFLCYTPYAHAPEPAPSPCLSGGGVTFGSFNHLAKLSDRTVSLWTRTVLAAGDSRLLLKAKALRDERVRAGVRERFRRAGLPADRLELAPPDASRADHLAMYGRVDIGLDPFPYHGTTTTCEAFHMGVPVVSLVGEVHAARVGLSLLHAVGLPELAAGGEEEFVRIAGELAADRARLADLRKGMRARLLASPLCDTPGYGRRLGAVLRELWRRRCAGRTG